MDFENSGLTKEELRRKRRRQEQTRAIALLAGAVAVVLLVLVIVIVSVVKVFTSRKDKSEDILVDAVTSEAVPESYQENEAELEETTTDTSVDESASEDSQETESEQGTDTETDSSESEEGEVSESEESAFIFDESENEELEKLVNETISEMSIENKVAALFILTPAQLMGQEQPVTTVGSKFGDKTSQYPVGGIVLDETNMASETEYVQFMSDIQMYLPEYTFMAIEDAGGENSPFVEAGLTENIISSQKEIGESLGEAGAYSAGISVGSELRQYKFKLNLAPIVDVALKPDSVAATKGFGADATKSALLTKNYIKGLSDQNLFTTVGRFPGYGDSTHEGESGQVVSRRTKEDLKKEYAPYLEGIDAGADLVMVSHVSLPAVRGDNRPACLSKEIVTDIIRTEWEYNGIIITDFMDRSCMYQNYTYAEAAVGAIEAGVDMILCPKNFLKSYNGILDAVKKGTITEERINESLKRIYRVKLVEELQRREEERLIQQSSQSEQTDQTQQPE